MSELYSIWLMPGPEDAKLLAGLASDLAGSLGGPRFTAHLTLMEEAPRPLEAMRTIAEATVRGIGRLSAPIEAVGTSELYFRSFYIRFAAEGQLARLRQRAVTLVAPERTEAFMPHVSLLYGIADSAEKENARRIVESRIKGRRIGFDRVAVVASAKTIPIADWAEASSHALGEAGAGVEANAGAPA